MEQLTLITAALPSELASFTSHLRNRQEVIPGKRNFLYGRLEKGATTRDVAVLFTGLGQQAAQKSLLEALQQISPRLVLISGTAGALSAQARVGDIIFASNYGTEILNRQLLKIAAKAADSGISTWYKPLYTAEQVVWGSRNKAQLMKKTGAFAVDMESAAMAQVLQEKGIRHAVVRAISDGLNDLVLISFEKVMTAEGLISYSNLAGYLLARPWKIPGLMAFYRQFYRACSKLAVTLENILTERV
ncbi:MAG: hypothetical protein R6U91_09875 [Bacillota bacterium]